MFKYWNQTLNLQLILLQFVKEVRFGDFQAYITVLTILSTWMFSQKHYNYARWLPIHIRTMPNLKENIQLAYMEGKFTVQKTNFQKPIFSNIGLEHNYEQLNGKIKGVGEATGLTENDSSL